MNTILFVPILMHPSNYINKKYEELVSKCVYIGHIGAYNT